MSGAIALLLELMEIPNKLQRAASSPHASTPEKGAGTGSPTKNHLVGSDDVPPNSMLPSRHPDDDDEVLPMCINARLRRLIPPRGSRFHCDGPDTCMVVKRSKNANLVAYTPNLLDEATNEPVSSGVARRCRVNRKDPIHAYWIKCEAEHCERRRARGEESDICELNRVERMLAYGCSAVPIPLEKFLSGALPKSGTTPKEVHNPKLAKLTSCFHSFHPISVKYVALSSYPVLLLTLPPLDLSVLPPSIQSDVPEATSLNDTMVVMLCTIGGTLSLLKHVYVASVEPKRFYQLPSVEYIEVFGISIETGDETYEKKIP